MTNGEIIAEAFNATAGIKDITKMRWVSLGIPRLLVRKDGIHNSTVIFANNVLYTDSTVKIHCQLSLKCL